MLVVTLERNKPPVQETTLPLHEPGVNHLPIAQDKQLVVYIFNPETRVEVGERLVRVPVKGSASLVARQVAETVSNQRAQYGDITAVMFSPRTTYCIYVQSDCLESVRQLIPLGPVSRYRPLPPFQDALDERRSFLAEESQWVLVPTVDGAGQPYLAPGVVWLVDRVEVTVYALQKTRRGHALLPTERELARAFHVKTSSIVEDVEDGSLYVHSHARGNSRRFMHGLEVVRVNMRLLRAPPVPPSTSVLSLFRTALEETQPQLWAGFQSILEAAATDGIRKGSPCKVTQGPLAGATGTIISDPPRYAEPLKVALKWQDEDVVTELQPGELAMNFETGDEVKGRTVSGTEVSGVITGTGPFECSRVIDTSSFRRYLVVNSTMRHNPT